MKKYINDQHGQALLIVIVALTIALVIGINASVRTITSLSRTSRTDSASRALAASEGGLERFLVLSKDAMDDAVAGNCPDLPNITEGELGGVSGCYVSFATDTDAIDSEAFVTVEAYAPDIYPFSLASGQIREINLEGYTGTQVDLCWGPQTGSGSDLSFVLYSSNGILQNNLVRGTNPPINPDYDANGTIPTNSSNSGYSSGCRRITLPSDGSAFGLRVRSIGGDSNIGAFGVNNHTLPLQGYKITSIGKLVQQSNIVATRKLQMIRTLPYLPGAFDFSYYTYGDIIK